MTFSATIDGMTELKQLTDSGLARRMQDAGMYALYIHGAAILTAAQKQTPVDTGALRRNVYEEKPTMGAQSISMGFASPYALYVEMDDSARHTSGKAHYFGDAVSEAMPSLGDRVKQTALDVFIRVDAPLTALPSLHPESPKFSTAGLPPSRHRRRARAKKAAKTRRARRRGAA